MLMLMLIVERKGEYEDAESRLIYMTSACRPSSNSSVSEDARGRRLLVYDRTNIKEPSRGIIGRRHRRRCDGITLVDRGGLVRPKGMHWQGCGLASLGDLARAKIERSDEQLGGSPGPRALIRHRGAGCCLHGDRLGVLGPLPNVTP